eukprot:CAMPEP_0201239740 /NCGR_PEP_ID=MMETSP0852-20130820/26304_1 /ASSEMBLY_ACC=CAM_ASM_000632 /TAXON_ID=183588 /ORGANISM="Pseudo-nitzschia fraudulenta, Strain WWA7" /LENGTH=49 /DNA_ID= /DNA_START= /DNA_END= /DNA_ORIENTATION=
MKGAFPHSPFIASRESNDYERYFFVPEETNPVYALLPSLVSTETCVSIR